MRCAFMDEWLSISHLAVTSSQAHKSPNFGSMWPNSVASNDSLDCSWRQQHPNSCSLWGWCRPCHLHRMVSVWMKGGRRAQELDYGMECTVRCMNELPVTMEQVMRMHHLCANNCKRVGCSLLSYLYTPQTYTVNQGCINLNHHYITVLHLNPGAVP